MNMKKVNESLYAKTVIKIGQLWNNPIAKGIILFLLAAFVYFLPNRVPLYIQRIAIMIGFYMVLGLSLNFTSGYLGQVSLGHAAFYAIGAYTTVLLTTYRGTNYVVAVILGACLAGVFGALLALSTMRLSGTYVVIVTMAFFYVISSIILNWESVTRGAVGIYNIPAPVIFGQKLTLKNGGIFYLIMFYVALTVLVTKLIINSKIGRAIKAIRDDELVAVMMGINIKKYKVIAYILCAFFAGLAGTLYGPFIGYINNATFNYDICMSSLVIIILGGIGQIKGALIGSIIITPLGELLRGLTTVMKSLPPWMQISQPEQWRFVIYGLIMVLMMRFRPQGILGGQSKLPYKMPKGISRKEGE